MKKRFPKPNILVIILDTVRARSTSFDNKAITPTLERVATEGAHFEEAIAPAPWTLSSHTSIFTGLYPTEHGVTRYNRSLPAEYEPLASTLGNAGYATGLFTPNQFLTDVFGMDRGFDRSSFTVSSDQTLFDDGLDFTRFAVEHDHQLREMASALPIETLRGSPFKNLANIGYFLYNSAIRNLSRTTDHESARWDDQAVAEAEDFIREQSTDGPFFAMVNLIEAHGPWPFDRSRLDAIGVKPDEVAPEQRWRDVAKQSADQWEYLSGDVEFDEVDREILTALYESWVHSVDAVAGRLLDVLDEQNVREETLVILTADHGECIAKDGVLGHELSVDRDATHVPLAISGPGVEQTTISDPVSLKDIYGTLLSAAGIDVDAPSLFSEEAQGIAFAETANVSPNRVGDSQNLDDERLGKQVALYTSSGRVERRYASDTVIGDRQLLDQLDAFVEGLRDRSESESVEIEVDSQIEAQLDKLGYLE